MSSLLRLCLTFWVVAPALGQAAVLENPSGGNFYSGSEWSQVGSVTLMPAYRALLRCEYGTGLGPHSPGLSQ